MKPVLLILIMTALSGCAILDNLDGAMALKDFSQERDAQDAAVKVADAKFARLLEQLRMPDELKHYQLKANIVNEFGPPVFCRDAAGLDQCLWRQSISTSQSPRVYIYFDGQGKLQRWERS